MTIEVNLLTYRDILFIVEKRIPSLYNKDFCMLKLRLCVDKSKLDYILCIEDDRGKYFEKNYSLKIDRETTSKIWDDLNELIELPDQVNRLEIKFENTEKFPKFHLELYPKKKKS